MKAKKVYSMKSSKSQMIRDALTANPTAKVVDLMVQFNCSDALIYSVKHDMKKKAGKTLRVTKQAKANAIAKNSANGVRLGRPPKAVPVVEPKTISMVEASYAMRDLVNTVKGMCISFDQARDKIDVLWNEEVYQVDIADLPKAIDSIKYLKSKELSFNITND